MSSFAYGGVMQTWGYGLLAVLVVGVFVGIGGLLRWIKDHDGLIWVLMRFASGIPMSGVHRTDAGWIRPGRHEVKNTSGKASGLGPPSRWEYLPVLARAGVRWAALAVLLFLGVLGVRNFAALVVLLVLIFAAAMVFAVLGVMRAVKDGEHMRRYVRPLHEVLAPKLEVPQDTNPRDWLTVPRDFNDDDHPVIVNCPPKTDVSDAQVRNMIGRIVSSKLAMEGTNISIDNVGQPQVIVRATVPPPDTVLVKDVKEILENVEDGKYFLGLGRKGVIRKIDLDSESPHIAISAGSGGGKSILTRALTMQALRLGAVVLVLDIKRESHLWLRGLPGVVYCRSIEDIHDAGVALQAEGDRRAELGEELIDLETGERTDAEVGPRLIVVAEELNATINRLERYWRKIKTKEDPNQSPAVEGITNVLFTGRSLGMNMFAIAQRLSAKAIGGGDARENFATVMMARYKVQTWKMLAPEVWPMPKSTKHAGRWQMVFDGSAAETQVLFASHPEARQFAQSGLQSKLELVTEGGQPRFVTTRLYEGGKALPTTPKTITQGDDPGVNPEAPRSVSTREQVTTPTQQPWISTQPQNATQSNDGPSRQLPDWARQAPAPPQQSDTESDWPPTPGTVVRHRDYPGQDAVVLAGGTRHYVEIQAQMTGVTGTLRREDWPRFEVIQAPEQTDAPRLELVGDPEDNRLTLSDALEQGIVTAPSINALRMARKQDPDFPAPVGKSGPSLLYAASDLRRWNRNRPRASGE